MAISQGIKEEFSTGSQNHQPPQLFTKLSTSSSHSKKTIDTQFFNQLITGQSYLHFFLLLVSFVLLTLSFLTNDFSVALVVNHSSVNLPIFYKIAAVWGNHEGSILLWGLVLAFYIALVAKFSSSIAVDFKILILSILALINTWLLSYMLFLSNPFARFFPPALQGSELNPLLQDWALIFHPPLLYLGYVGLAVPFAIVLTALIKKQLNAHYLLWMRPWVMIAWIFLTAGVSLGSFWAYYELGWGGWWFWDPVENSSFMPWLIATALLHSVVVSQKRGSYKNWTVILALVGFNLSLLGTFLVRSGVITSVHSFATDPNKGLFILLFLAFFTALSLGVYITHFSAIKTSNRYLSLLSRETMILLGNILLVAAFIAVFLGTLYPLFLEALNLPMISIGKPYYNQVFVPLMIPVIFLLAIAPWQSWSESSFNSLFYPAIKHSFIVSILIGIWGYWFWANFSVALALFLSFFIFLLMVIRFIKPTFLFYQSTKKLSFKGQSFSAMAMQIAHIGVAFFVIGATFNTQFATQRELVMEVGESYQFENYTIKLEAVDYLFAANYDSYQAKMLISKNLEPTQQRASYPTAIYPEKREYQSGRLTSESAIYSRFLEDITISFAEVNDNQYSFRFYYQPLIRLVWLGVILMIIGGVIAVLDKRFRAGSSTASSLNLKLNSNPNSNPNSKTIN